MVIVSWNCNGKFREKFEQIHRIDADIYVIQECENPQKYKNSEYFNFAKNHIWIGENQNKGLGVFAKEGIELKLNNLFQSYCLRYFLALKVNNEFDLLAVWAGKPYIEEYYIYQSINKNNFNKKTIIIGDFNSNAIWDAKNACRTHTAVVEELKQLGLTSAYHFVFNEAQGKESQKSFYLYRHKDKSYHIDYAFLAPSTIKSFQIESNDNWLAYSDHKPIILETK